jgi:hypothetical protein
VIRSNLLGRRILSTAVVLLAIGGLGIILGTRTRSATIQPAAVSDLKATNSERAQGPDLLSERPLTGSVTGQPSASNPQTSAGKSSIESFTYVIQPKDTLRDLCVSMLGRYDRNVLSEIRELNPELKNPDLLEVGQEVRLPMATPK